MFDFIGSIYHSIGTNYDIYGTKLHCYGTKYCFAGTELHFCGAKYLSAGTKYHFCGTKYHFYDPKNGGMCLIYLIKHALVASFCRIAWVLKCHSAKTFYDYKILPRYKHHWSACSGFSFKSIQVMLAGISQNTTNCKI